MWLLIPSFFLFFFFFLWLYWVGERLSSDTNTVHGAAATYKIVFDLSAAYFKLSFHRYWFSGSAFGNRMMLRELKQAFKWNIKEIFDNVFHWECWMFCFVPVQMPKISWYKMASSCIHLSQKQFLGEMKRNVILVGFVACCNYLKFFFCAPFICCLLVSGSCTVECPCC